MATNDLSTLRLSPLSERSVPMMPRHLASQGMSFQQLIAILWAWRKASLLIAGTVVALAALAIMLMARTYTSTATLMVNFEVNDPLAGSEFPIGLLGSYMATQVELARGSEVLQPVIKRLELHRDQRYAKGYSGEPAGLNNWIEDRLRRDLLVEQGRYGSQLIYVSFSASDSAEAARVANTIAEVYSEQQHLRLTGPANERAKRYTAQLADLQGKVVAAQLQVSSYRRESGLVDSDAKSNIDMQLLYTLEQRLLESQNASRVAEARAIGDQSVGSQVLGSTMIQSLKTQLALQSARLAELQATLGERHPQLLELTQQRGATQRALNAELGAYRGNASSELASAQQLERKLQAAVEKRRSSVREVRQLQDDGTKYQLELESAQSVYKRALDGYDQVMLASSGAYTNLNFVSRATPASKASKPKVMKMILAAVVLGGLLGLGLPLAYEMLNRRVRCRDDIERDHGIPVLAELGSMHSGPSRFALGQT